MARNEVKPPYSLLFDANPLMHSKTGVGYYVDNLIGALAKTHPRDLKITGHYFNFLGKKSTEHLVQAPSITYRSTKYFPTKVLGALRRLARIELPLEPFSRQRADITLFTNFVSLPMLTHSLNTVFIYDMAFLDCPEYVSDRNGSYLRRWVPKSARRADVVVTISEFTKQRIIELLKVGADKIYVTPIPPVPHETPDYSIYEKFSLKKGYLLFVGTIEPRKNLSALLDAYDQLPEAVVQKHQLVLAGGKGWKDAEILARLEKIKAAGKKVVATGYLNDAEKSALYEGAALCVQPSHYEGFGMPVLEAMSYGKPVACSDIPVLREIAGNAAIFFDQDKPEAIAKAVRDLLADKNQLDSLAAKGKQLADSFPTWDSIAEGLYEFMIAYLRN